MALVGFIVGVDIELLQDVSATATRRKGVIVLPEMFTFYLPLSLAFYNEPPNGLRYPRVGGVWIRSESGKKTQSQKKAGKSRRLPHVGCTLCWALDERKTRCLKQDASVHFRKIIAHDLTISNFCKCGFYRLM
jgi:hypothetical protein